MIRFSADTITDNALDELYAAVEEARQQSQDADDRAVDLNRRIAELEAAAARVRDLHQPMERGPFTICAHCSGWDGEWRCRGVVTNWPCPTVSALDDPREAR